MGQMARVAIAGERVEPASSEITAGHHDRLPGRTPFSRGHRAGEPSQIGQPPGRQSFIHRSEQGQWNKIPAVPAEHRRKFERDFARQARGSLPSYFCVVVVGLGSLLAERGS